MLSTIRPLTVILAAGALAAMTAGGAEAATGWQPEKVPVASGDILAMTRLTSHVTWAAGLTATTSDDGGTTLSPVVLAKDDRTGTGWQRVVTPADGVESRINAISAHGADDVWVVGDNQNDGPGPLGTPVLAEHWNGHSWKIASVPVDPNVSSANLLGVSTLSPTDAWAVGTTQARRGDQDIYNTIIEHWNGRAWQAVKLPVDAGEANLFSITASGPNDVWAAGSLNRQPLVLHYDGKTWSQAPSLPTTPDEGEFNTVLANNPHDVWAAGDVGAASGPLVEHFDGHSWTRVTAPGAGEIFATAQTPGGVAFVGY
ncbi:MAG TPA: hypothetical protein VGL02_31700, partial [Streptomyces sp.]